MSPGTQKTLLRRRLRERLRAVTSAERAEARARLIEVLWGCPLLREDTRLLAFFPYQTEVDIGGFLRMWIAARRDLMLPRVGSDGSTLEVWRLPHELAVLPGYRNILEPDPEQCLAVELSVVDAVLVPGLAFERSGARLGQGGGHYDRLLARLAPGVPRIGVAYDWQVLDGPAPLEHGLHVPRAGHDQQVQWLATPTGLVECLPRKEG